MKKFKGIILAGGVGTRLYPITAIYSKQLINIYDKPMIYYPLSLLMMMGIKDILIITDQYTVTFYRKLFDDGHDLGLNITYCIQYKPNGIADAFIIGEDFIQKDNVVLILGDNVFYGDSDFWKNAINNHEHATIFAYYVNNPEKYGVIELDNNNQPVSIEEKPAQPKSKYVVPGLYLYDSSVISIAKSLQPSYRNEIEITDVNKHYLSHKQLKVEKIGRGIAWLDTGSADTLLEASSFIAAVEHRQGLKIGCIEEIAIRNRWISIQAFENLISRYPQCNYKTYLQKIKEEIQCY